MEENFLTGTLRIHQFRVGYLSVALGRLDDGATLVLLTGHKMTKLVKVKKLENAD